MLSGHGLSSSACSFRGPLSTKRIDKPSTLRYFGVAAAKSVACSTGLMMAAVLENLDEPSAEREDEGLESTIEELDLERSVHDRPRLTDQLIQTLFDNESVAALVDIETVSWTRRLSVDRHTQTDGTLASRRPHDEMQIACVEAVHDPAGGAA